MKTTMTLLLALALAAVAGAGTSWPWLGEARGFTEPTGPVLGVDGLGPWCSLSLRESGMPGPPIVFRQPGLYARCAATRGTVEAVAAYEVRRAAPALGAAPAAELRGVKLTVFVLTDPGRR